MTLHAEVFCLLAACGLLQATAIYLWNKFWRINRPGAHAVRLGWRAAWSGRKQQQQQRQGAGLRAHDSVTDPMPAMVPYMLQPEIPSAGAHVFVYHNHTTMWCSMLVALN